MAVPLDAIRAIHNAFREDMKAIDTAAHESAQGLGSLDRVLKRYTFFNEVLVWHAQGEEEYVCSAPQLVKGWLRESTGYSGIPPRILKVACNPVQNVNIRRCSI